MTDNQSPRVLRLDVAKWQSPRVAEMETIKANDIIKSVTQVRKKIGQTIHIGTVINYNKDTKKYTIQYYEGYHKNMIHIELVKHKFTTYKNAVNRLKRHQ